MDQNFQTSFIPKKPIVKERVSYSQPVGILMVASIFILFTVLIASGGLYFYKGILSKNITDMQNTLVLAQSRFELSKISELQVLDKRLNASTEILSKHVAISPIFTVLEAITMKTVRFTKFGYTLGSDKNAAVDIKMSGVAKGYRDIALQSDLFTSNAIAHKNFINPIFSNLTLDASGNVLFDLEFSVDSLFVNYKQTLLTQS
jgi:hypothetical protein